MQTTRRNLFKFAAGSAAGVLFTPLPWRLITDTALWSENWPGIPRPRRGPIRTRFTHCALCPAGCPVRARCVGDQPISLTGLAGQPLCAVGLTGHHMPYHPGRVREGSPERVMRAIAEAKGTVAVLDLQPGRTASWTYRRAMAAMPNGLYLAPKSALPAVDLAQARTVLSFGVPVLDGWGTPHKVLAAREHFRLIQVEAVESRTAALADLWIPIRPGTEAAFARAVGQAIVANPTPAGMPAPRSTGILACVGQAVQVARELTQNGPALVLAADDNPVCLELNAILGSLGRTVVARREAPVPASWKNAAPVTAVESVPDGSIRVLLIDESVPANYIPWSIIQKKLRPKDPLVVTFASSRAGYGRHSQFVLPTAVYPEILQDVAPAIDEVHATFRLSSALIAAPAGVVDPAQFVARLAGLPVTDTLRERADVIHRAGRGTLVTYASGPSVPVKNVNPDDFWKALNEGGYWTDPAATTAPKWQAALSTEPAAEASELPLIAVTAAVPQPMSPLLSKLYVESNLRASPGCAALDPETARQCRVADGSRAVLETSAGRAPIQITVDAGVPPGVVYVAATPDLLDLCGHSARAKVVAL